MTVKNLIVFIEKFPENKVFEFSFSEPFSYKADPSTIAFSIEEKEITKNDLLKRIEKVFEMSFSTFWRKNIKYSDDTDVIFEKGSEEWTDGGYTISWINKLYERKSFESFEEKLLEMLFK